MAFNYLFIYLATTNMYRVFYSTRHQKSNTVDVIAQSVHSFFILFCDGTGVIYKSKALPYPLINVRLSFYDNGLSAIALEIIRFFILINTLLLERVNCVNAVFKFTSITYFITVLRAYK